MFESLAFFGSKILVEVNGVKYGGRTGRPSATGAVQGAIQLPKYIAPLSDDSTIFLGAMLEKKRKKKNTLQTRNAIP